MSDFTIITNNQPRDLIEWWELTDSEKSELDYLTEFGECKSGPHLFRYRDSVYDVDEFTTIRSLLLPGNELRKWSAYQCDSFFSGILVRWSDDFRKVTVGRYYC